jgi:hypothetical protein
VGIGDELQKLSDLHDSGELTDEEYARAKEAALREASAAPEAEPGDSKDASMFGGLFGGDQSSLGGAANRYVNFQITMAVIGLIIFLVFACSVLPNFNRPAGFGP